MRFAFNDEWHKLKLKDFTSRVTRKNINCTSQRPLTISAQLGLIDQNDFFDKQIASKDMSNYYLLLNGEFAYNKSYSNDYPLGAIKRLDRYTEGALSSLYICFKVNNEVIDSDYLTHYFESSKWHKEIINISGEGARNHGLLNMSVDDFFNTNHFIPSLNEQRKISKLLNAIIMRIDTQSKIIKEYKLLKNAITNQLIFHNKKMDKHISLKNFATLKNGYAFKSESYVDNGDFNIITIANVQGNKYIDTTQCNKINKIPNDIQPHQILKNNDILISLTGNVGRVSLVNTSNCLLNQRVGVLNFINEKFKNYIYQVISNKKFEKTMILCGQGAAQKNIGNDDIESFLIPLSDNLEYINKIVNLLDNLDKKIAIEEHIINDYLSQKKYMLCNMFI